MIDCTFLDTLAEDAINRGILIDRMEVPMIMAQEIAGTAIRDDGYAGTYYSDMGEIHIYGVDNPGITIKEFPQ